MVSRTPTRSGSGWRSGPSAGLRTLGGAAASRAPARTIPPLKAARTPPASLVFRGPEAVTSIAPAGSIVIETVPSVSVRSTRAPVPWRRSIVERAGCPYGLPAPADTIATRGWTASRKAGVDAVALPWWATFRMSTGGRPRLASSGSTSSSTSPVSRNRRPATSPSSTTETSLMPRPASGGSSGTRPGSGQRTRSRIPSRPIDAPVASSPCGGAPGRSRSLANARYPGPGPRMPVS